MAEFIGGPWHGHRKPIQIPTRTLLACCAPPVPVSVEWSVGTPATPTEVSNHRYDLLYVDDFQAVYVHLNLPSETRVSILLDCVRRCGPRFGYFMYLDKLLAAVVNRQHLDEISDHFEWLMLHPK